MGPEVLVIFVIGMVGPVVLAGLIMFWWATANERTHVETLWQRYARSRGLVFVPAAGEWPNRSAPAVRWEVGDVEYRIEARADETLRSTRVIGRPRVAVCGTFALQASSSLPARADTVVTGDPLIDARFSVQSRPSRLALDVLTPEVKRALVSFGGSLRYEHGDVQLSWAGGEENDARLDEARRLVVRVVDALSPAAP